jgi:voltage-gated potassium channel
MAPQSTASPDIRPTELLMLGLSLYVLAALTAEAFLPLSADTREVLRYVDTGVCCIFLTDFFVSLFRAKNKREFLKWGWIDFVSSIPMLDFTRAGRAVRVFRVLRILRGVRSIKMLSTFILRRRAEAAFSAAALISILLVIFSSVAILEMERGQEGANIQGPADAIWWSYVTITTVGYGDRYPVTTGGRIIAAFLMTAGVGLFGTFTGFVASWFLASGQKEENAELAAIREQLEDLNESVQADVPAGAP